MKKERIWHLDLVRSFCILWIVVIWHNGNIISHNVLTNFITTGILGAFTYLSGLLLGSRNNKFNNIKDILLFYLNRIKRLYPFFFLSALLFLTIPWLRTTYVKSFEQFIHTITFSACFFKDMPGTIWYVCMIFLYYFITPFILLKDNIYYKICISFLFLILFLLLYYNSYLDERILIFYPIFIFGLIVKIKKQFNIYILLLIIICLFFSYYMFYCKINILFNSVICALCLGIFIEYLCRMVNNIKVNIKFYNLIIYVSYSSMLIYLFHRHYFLINKAICKITHFNCILLNILLIPIFVYCCYLIQQFYDNLLKKI